MADVNMFSVDKAFNILVVDNDRTCLLHAKECMEKWNYKVTTANSVAEALEVLRSSEPLDLVMTEVDMPDVHGFQFLPQIVEEFNLPVVYTSADTRAKVEGIDKGAQSFLVKPIGADDVKHIYLYVLWWRVNKKNRSAPVAQHHTGQNINASEGASSSATRNSTDHETSERRNVHITWEPDLHSRFVEAILLIGCAKAVPTNILETMNVQGLTTGQVGSHLQKYKKFLQLVLNGRMSIECSPWIDLNYHSSVVGGNPDVLLINHLRNEQRNGRLAAHNPLRPINTGRAPNGRFSSSAQYSPLPPFTRAEAGSIRNATLPTTYSGNMGNIAGCGTESTIRDVTDQTRYYYGNMVSQVQNNYHGGGGGGGGGLIGGAVNDMIPSTHNVAPSMGNNYGNSSIGPSFNASQFGNTTAVNNAYVCAEAGSMRSAIPTTYCGNIGGFSTANTIQDPIDMTGQMRHYNENRLSQVHNNYHGDGGLVEGAINDMIPSTNNVAPSLGNNNWNSSIGRPLHASPFGNTSALNAHMQQLGGQGVIDGSSWFFNNGSDGEEPSQ